MPSHLCVHQVCYKKQRKWGFGFLTKEHPLGPKERKKNISCLPLQLRMQSCSGEIFFPLEKSDTAVLTLPWIVASFCTQFPLALPQDSSLEAAVIGYNSKGNTEEFHGSDAIIQKHSSSWEHLRDVPEPWELEAPRVIFKNRGTTQGKENLQHRNELNLLPKNSRI